MREDGRTRKTPNANTFYTMSAPVTNILELGIRYRATFFDAMNRCDSEDYGE